MDTISSETLSDARNLWKFHRGSFEPMAADFVLALGSHDERVAKYAAELILQEFAPLLVTSGGLGKVTEDTWTASEGERFAQIARGMGVSDGAILVESEARNTGDNITKTRALLSKAGVAVTSGILVTKPYMCRRAYATATKQWPEITWSVGAPSISFEEYPNTDVPLRQTIEL